MEDVDDSSGGSTLCPPTGRIEENSSVILVGQQVTSYVLFPSFAANFLVQLSSSLPKAYIVFPPKTPNSAVLEGDRIHGTICKPGLDLFRERVKEHAVYRMRNFIVKINNGKVRTTAHKYKLSFYTKTEVEVLPIEKFAFNPFKFCPFAELESNAPMDGNLLFDYIGEVVAKEEAMGMITRTKLYYAFRSRKHKIKCTLFGELVDQVLPHLERDDGEPFIMVVQLFKSNVYLNFVNVQSTYYVSKYYFNLNLLEVIDFKKRLAEEVVPCSQRITPLQSQPQYSVADEINAGIVPICTIEEVLNMTQETSCWIVGNVVSLEVGKDDWSYTSCKTCPKKVLESKDRYWCDHCRRVGFKAMLRYRLQIIMTDGSGCMKLLLWNKEVEKTVGKAVEKIKELSKWEKGESYPKSLDTIVDKRFLFKLNITYKNINAVEGVYNILKISDDEYLMSIFGSANSSFNASVSMLLALNMYLISLQLKQVIIAMDMR
ncbi:replication protein A 70 kDa DNA-binding subunit D-like [Arachis hypogaea]|uniref:replication protein A 70 kDa DNA-binding subunit D-like n=1 Tax=Arachis hypogaea TaxID=3818 RepID=UPI003B21F08C